MKTMLAMLFGVTIGAGLVGLVVMAEKGFWFPMFVLLIIFITWTVNLSDRKEEA